VPAVPVELVLLVVSLLDVDVGFVEAVVFKLPLVFSFVVLGLVLVVPYVEVEDGEVESVAVLVACELESLLEGEVLYIPALELLELGEAEDD
jgi:hypothetical protein